MPRLRFAAWLAMVVLVQGLASPVQAAVITILDGDAVLIDGAEKFSAVEGQHLGERVLISTGPRTSLLRVEWADGTVIDFGPDTQAMLTPGALNPGDKRLPAFYLLAGWAKQASLKDAPSAGMASADFQVHAFRGVVLTRAAGSEGFVFVERGAAEASARGGHAPTEVSLASGQAWLLQAGKLSAAQRLGAQELRSVPRGLRESLPLRLAQASSKTEARRLGPPSYAELAPWLRAEPALRREFPKRFQALSQDAAFRKALLDNLSLHPEWSAVLESRARVAAPR